MRSMRCVKMTVFPLPVARDTPSRLCPLSRYDSTDWMHSSWYSRRVICRGETRDVAAVCGVTRAAEAAVDALRIGATMRPETVPGRLEILSAYWQKRYMKRYWMRRAGRMAGRSEISRHHRSWRHDSQKSSLQMFTARLRQ